MRAAACRLPSPAVDVIICNILLSICLFGETILLIFFLMIRVLMCYNDELQSQQI